MNFLFVKLKSILIEIRYFYFYAGQKHPTFAHEDLDQELLLRFLKYKAGNDGNMSLEDKYNCVNSRHQTNNIDRAGIFKTLTILTIFFF